MVRYISQYDVLVQMIHASDGYQNATGNKRQEIDKWLGEEKVRKYFSSRVVPQLTLYESFALGVMNSDALKKRTPEEQQKVMTHVSSGRFKRQIDNLEARMNNLLGV